MSQVILKPPSLRWQQTRRILAWIAVAALLGTWATLVLHLEEVAFCSLLGAGVLGGIARGRLGRACAGLAAVTFITVLALECNGRKGSAATPKEARIRGLPASATNIRYSFHGAFGP